VYLQNVAAIIIAILLLPPWVFRKSIVKVYIEMNPGTREKVRSKRINLEGNTHAQEINVSQLPV
jgi:hypothetical protein